MSGRPGRCGDSLQTNRYAVLRNKSLRRVYISDLWGPCVGRPLCCRRRLTMCLNDCSSGNDRWLSDSRRPQVT